MPTVLPSAMPLKKTAQVPRLASLLINAGSGSDECSLCGNAFEVGEETNMSWTLPCVDEKCEPCARMWRIVSSPICAVCYADFTCPKVATDRANISSPQMDIDSTDAPQQQSPSDSQTVSPPSFQDMCDAFYGVPTDSDDNTISDLGSPMRDDADEIAAVGELNDEDLWEALMLANKRAGTNFNIGEIEAEIPRACVRKGNKTQLVDTLTQFMSLKASESDEDEGEDEKSRLPEGDKPDDATAQKSSVRCVYCRKTFRTNGHLRQHMQIHMIVRRTCKICGRVLGNSASRRCHEKMHQETESEREERLRRAKVARAERAAEAGKRVRKQKRRERVSKVSK